MVKSMKLACRPACIRACSIDVTPLHFPVALAGFGSGVTAFRAEETLEMNAILFGEGEHAILLVSIDALFVCDMLIDWFAEALELSRERISIAASHTHYAPAVDQTKPRLGLVDSRYQVQLRRAVGQLCQILHRQKPSAFRLRHGAASTEAGVYRRIRWPFPHIGGRSQLVVPPGIENAPDFDVEIPNIVRSAVMEIQSTVGGIWSPIAVLWCLACHPTRYHQESVVSSDFVGTVRNAFRLRYDDQLPVLFFQGFSGDINPRPAKRNRKFTLASIVFGPRAKPFDEAEWSAWANRIASRALDALELAGKAKPVETIGMIRAAIPISEIVQDASSRDVTAVCLEIGELRIVQIGAEVVNFHEASLPPHVWKVGCSGPVFGYWPSNVQVQEGGYEGGGYFTGFGLSGKLKPMPEMAFGRLMELVGLNRKRDCSSEHGLDLGV